MPDENIKRAAQEYLAERLNEDGLTQEQKLNRDAAIELAPQVWREVVLTAVGICKEWNAETKEETFSCNETPLGDLRIRCAGRPQQIVVHYDSRRRLIHIENTARLDHEPKVILSIEAYPTEAGRGARLMRNSEPVNLPMLLLGHMRVLAGMSRKAQS